MSSRSKANQTRREQMHAEMLRQKAKAKRRSRLMIVGAAVAAVLIIGGTIVVIGQSKDSSSGGPSSAAPTAVMDAITSIPASTFDTVGKGAATAGPAALPDGTPLSQDSKPRVMYVGAEYCPFCAAERWPMVVAMSRFGTFSDLGVTHSASEDVYPDTATLSFHGSSYSSDYLAFDGYELQGNTISNGRYETLDTLSDADAAIVSSYNLKKYTGGSDGGIPFVYFAGKYVSSGASFTPEVLSGLTQQQIADKLADPNDPVSQAIVGSANVVTAKLCTLTDNKPADVCNSAGVKAAS